MSKPINRVFTYILFMFGIFLNQADVIFGVNTSTADLFFMLILFILLLQNRIKVHKYVILFFLLLTVFIFYTSLYYVPRQFLYYPSLKLVIVNYIKLLVVFLYFVAGFSLSIEENKVIVKWYSYAAVAIGFFGFILSLSGVQAFNSSLFYGGLRLRGLMNDPNYFAIIQNSAIVYFSREKRIKKALSVGLIAALFLSIITSGSKTGMITLLCYTMYRIIEVLINMKITLKSTIVHILLLIPIIMLFPFVLGAFPAVLNILSDKLPAFDRVQLLFIDFDSAISGMGSNRDMTWQVALGLIRQSPVLGIGIGTYSGLAKKLYNTSSVAHNTYLQLLSEWGVILAVIFFLYFFFTIGKLTFTNKRLQDITVIQKDILLIFMIGSMAVSLNNARMFWLFLGMLIMNIQNQKIKIVS